MRRPLDSLMDRLLPPGLSGDALLRGRYYVIVCAAASGLLSVGVAWHLSSRLWGSAAVVGGSVVCILVMLAIYRRTGRLALSVHLSMVALMSALTTSALMHQPLDLMTIANFALVPAFVSLILGPRQTLPWMAVCVVVGLGALWLGQRGVPFAQADPAPEVTAGLNYLLLLAGLWIFARAYASQHARALERAHAADRAKTSFLAAIGHEIRTPMNGVLGMTEVLLQGELHEEQREQLQVVQRSGQVLVALINDLLDLAKAEAGRLTVSPEPFELAGLLHDVQTLFAPQAASRGVRLAVDAEPSLPPVLLGDAFRLRQVLSNLVSNAVKFTDAGHVTVRVRRGPGDLVDFEVEDSGIGIAPDVLPTLFTTFEQGGAGGRHARHGTGLGLALSQQLVVLMGGRVTVTSRLGDGSTFQFALPLPRTAQSASTRASPPPVSGGRRVLIVDDNPVNLAVAAGLLSRAGYLTDTAAGGEEAVERVAHGDYALVLMDCQMPGVDGYQATVRIRALPEPRCRVPIAAMTAAVLPEELEACRSSGMDAVLSKPLTWASLRRLLGSLLPADSAGGAPAAGGPR